MSDRVTRLEELVAELQRLTEDLSGVVARQEQQIATLSRRVAMLMSREAEREAMEGGSFQIADTKPPHY